MNYSIELDPQVASRLQEVPAEYAALVVEKLDLLGENPSLGERIHQGPLEGRMLYQFIVDHGPRIFRLAVLYLFRDDEETIFITEIGFLRGDADRRHIAENWP